MVCIRNRPGTILAYLWGLQGPKNLVKCLYTALNPYFLTDFDKLSSYIVNRPLRVRWAPLKIDLRNRPISIEHRKNFGLEGSRPFIFRFNLCRFKSRSEIINFKSNSTRILCAVAPFISIWSRILSGILSRILSGNLYMLLSAPLQYVGAGARRLGNVRVGGGVW